MASVSTKSKCEHPYKKCKKQRIEGWTGRMETCFITCDQCNGLVEWCLTGREIPYHWPDKMKDLAQKVTGYKIEQDPETRIEVPLEYTRWDGSTTMLKKHLMNYADMETLILRDSFKRANFAQAYGTKTGRFQFPIKEENK